MSYIREHGNEYFQKTYAGWLGKIIGIRLGSLIEGMTYEQIQGRFGYIKDYVTEYHDYAADDDSNGPLFFIRALIDFKEKRLEITPQDMAETWLNYVSSGHGFFWWGGYGTSTEHTAYLNLKHGIPAPRSGSIAQNGHTVAEQIGGQIFIDTWGMVKPDDVTGSAELAGKMISVSHDGEALLGGKFIVACISAAYTSGTVDEILDRALAVLPSDSHYRFIVEQVRKFYAEAEDKQDWEACFRWIKANYGYDRYPGNCHIIPNAAVMILSLLYGEGDYYRTQCICNSCGWDTDCNAGNVGTIIAVMRGIGNIPDFLIDPVKDLVIASSAIGYLNINTVSETAEMFARLGCMLEGCEAPAIWKDRENEHKKFYHFDMERSVNALRCEGPVITEGIREEDGHRRLRLYGHGTVTYKTYYCPTDFTDSRYDPVTSPVIYPGERFGFSLRNDRCSDRTVKLFWRDAHDKKVSWSDSFTVKSHETAELEMTVPAGDALVDRIGFAFEEDSSLTLDSFWIDGKVDYRVDTGKEIEEHYGWNQGHRHVEQRQFTYSEGFWETKDGRITGRCAHDGEMLTGEYGLENYDYEVTVLPVCGKNHYASFRMEGLARYYMFGLGENGKAVLYRKHCTSYEKLAECDFAWEEGKAYRLGVSVDGDEIVCSIDGKVMIEKNDGSYKHGAYGFTILDGSACRFSDLRVREH